ncbi:MAG: hypothetical protein Q9187_007311 [Circinaria calcarea]
MDSSRPTGGIVARRPAILSIAKLLLCGIANIPLLRAAPTRFPPFTTFAGGDPDPLPAKSPTLWIYLSVAVALVLLGGAFAGLTIALMGQDEIYLQVIKTSGEGSEKKNAAKVLRLLDRGKHWVLVTLLLGNVITNETLPIVLDRSLGGGWPAVLGSTVLIVIFGEIIPQSICVRYGLPIGAWMSPLVLVLMYILGPVAWPTAKLLDWLLGEEHGTTYKKAGLKTLVTLHKTLGDAGEQLNADEVTIISAVLDLKDKPIGSIMTPIDDVFTMSADTILDEKTMDVILSAGYSRIPIHAPNEEFNFVGMLLVKILITYDPEDCKAVRDFALATLPETWADTSCLDIVNFFQEGKSHMVLVSENPGTNSGALGVVTLEDVIEELIGEEIIDESDVFVDVHQAIRRNRPAPKSRMPKNHVVTNTKDNAGEGEENLIDIHEEQTPSVEAKRRLASLDGTTDGKTTATGDRTSSPKTKSFVRRTSSLAGVSDKESITRRNDREHLKHLGPSNLASRPRQTRWNTVKIKPGLGAAAEGLTKNSEPTGTSRHGSVSAPNVPQGGVGDGLLSSAGKDASDGVLAVQAGYGTIGLASAKSPKSPEKSKTPHTNGSPVDGDSQPTKLSQSSRTSSTTSKSTVASLPNQLTRSSTTRRGGVRSGSITENIVEAGGIRKVVLDTTSSSSEDADDGANGNGVGLSDNTKENEKPEAEAEGNPEPGKGGKKKRRRSSGPV